MNILLVCGLQLRADDDVETAPAASPLEVAWQQQRHAMITVRIAELEAAAAARRYDLLHGAPGLGNPSRWRQPCARACLRSLAKTVTGTGILLGVFYLALIVVVVLDPGPLLILPAAAALIAVTTVTVRTAECSRSGPVVEDLVSAVLEMREAQTALHRAREQAGAAAELVCRLAADGTGHARAAV